MKLTLTIQELVEAGPFSEGTLLTHIRTGALPARKIGRRVYVLVDDWRAFLEGAPLARDIPSPYHAPRAKREPAKAEA